MSHNSIDLSYAYSAELFFSIQNLKKLDIRSNMLRPYNYDKEFNYPDHAFGVLRELTFLGIDMMPVPNFGRGFIQITNLRELHFESCYLVRLSNETFQTFSSSVEELSLRNCQLHFVITEVGALCPFPHFRSLDFFGTFMHLTRALQLLNPYNNASITTINLGHVSDLSIDSDEFPYALTITSDIMKNLKTICIENLDLSQNGIVDYRRGSLFSFDHPECLQHLSLKGNRLSLPNRKHQKELNSFFGKTLRLKSLDYSYNVVNFIIKNSLNSNLNFTSSDGSYVILPKSVEKLDISFTIVNPLHPPLFIVPSINNLTHLDISYTTTTVGMYFMTLRLETYISAGTRYTLAWNELHLFPKNNIKTIVLKNAALNDGIDNKGNNLFTNVQSVETLDISENNIWYFSDDIFKLMQNLSNLYLTNNLLQSIPEQLNTLTKIKMLDVRNNLITSVSSTIRNWADKMHEIHGMTLYLDGNAFECTCDNVDLIRWIQATKVNLDSQSYKCKLLNGTIIDPRIAYNSISELFVDCKSTMWLTFVPTLLSTFVTLSLLLVVYSKRWKIIFFTYGIIRRVVERKVHKSYQYDVYISYEGEIAI
ncbi:toll-like receptor 4 [Mytilus californianus]|uniref:toll-like receptor 4 n=1 Tax=Mytilus californianus TaxID=6549 RepID=UPI002247F0C8|nr:toll-like receptor 4 [Mytilus californianus]